MLNSLEHISLLLDGTVKALRNLPSSQILLARQSLTCQSMKISRDKEGRKTNDITSTATNVPFVTNKDGIITPGLLPYVFEGVIPRLQVHIGSTEQSNLYQVCLLQEWYLSAAWIMIFYNYKRELSAVINSITCSLNVSII